MFVLAGAKAVGVTSHHRFVIKLNRRVGNSVCVVCGKTSELEVGPGIFTSSTDEHVCLDCGRAEAPELAALLALVRAAENYVTVLLESADHFSPEDLE